MNFHVNHVFLSGIFDSFGPQWTDEDGARHLVFRLAHRTMRLEDPPEVIDVETVAGVAEHVTRVAWLGAPVVVEGELVAREYEDGVKRHAVLGWRVQVLVRAEGRR